MMNILNFLVETILKYSYRPQTEKCQIYKEMEKTKGFQGKKKFKKDLIFICKNIFQLGKS